MIILASSEGACNIPISPMSEVGKTKIDLQGFDGYTAKILIEVF